MEFLWNPWNVLTRKKGKEINMRISVATSGEGQSNCYSCQIAQHQVRVYGFSGDLIETIN